MYLYFIAEAILKLVPQINELPNAKPDIVNKEKVEGKEKSELNKKVQEAENSLKTTTTLLPSTKPPYDDMPKLLDSFNEDDLVCSQEDYVQFKSDLLRYHCVRFRETHCDENIIPSKYKSLCLYIHDLLLITVLVDRRSPHYSKKINSKKNQYKN